MKSRISLVALAVVALVIGYLLGVSLPGNSALAQVGGGAASTSGRYQISAYAGMSGGNVHHGCYIVDTATGQVWHALHGGETAKVATKLP